MDHITQLVDELKKNPSFELEVRLGKIVNDTFEAGIDGNMFENLHQEMEKCSDLVTTETWSEEMNVFFEHETLGPLRTHVTYPNNTMMVESVTQTKHRIACVDFKSNTPYDFRIALSDEQVVSNANVPPLSNRRSYD